MKYQAFVDQHRKISQKELYKRLISLFQHEDSVSVLFTPDPDAMASALTLKRLLWNKVHNVALVYRGEIARLENKEMIRLLHLEMEHISNVDLGHFNKFALVDSQPQHSDDFSRFRFTVIIDHHPSADGYLDADLVDIRPHYGATSTILTEYIRAAGIRPSSRIATALYYGIKADTDNFERGATEADVRAFRYLFAFANRHIVRKIESSEITLENMIYFKIALQHYKLRNNKIYVHLGDVPDADICALVADFFMKVDSIGWSIASGIYRDNLIIVFRSDGLKKDAGKLANKEFGKLGKAGGHKGAARAEVPLKNLEKEEILPHDRRSVERFVLRKID